MDDTIFLYDEHAESALIGAGFLDPAIFCNGVEASDFGTPGYGVLWRACQRLARDGVTPDVVTLSPDVLIPNMNPINFISSCPSVARADSYTDIVRGWARRRKLERAASSFAKAAYEDRPDEHKMLLGEARLLLQDALAPDIKSTTLAQMVADDTPPTPDLIERFLPGRAVMLFSGPGGDGKSYAALDLAICVARGTPWLGLNVTKSPVVIVDLENDYEEIRKRAQWLTRGHNLGDNPPDITFYAETKHTLDSDGAVYELAGLMKRHDAKLLVLDSLVDFLGNTDENSNPEMGRVAKRLREVVNETGGVILAIHHTPKNNAQTPRGATALRNGVNVNTMVSREGNTLTLKHDKNRRGLEISIKTEMNWEDETFCLSLVEVNAGREKKTTDPDEQAILNAVDADWRWSNEIVNDALKHTTHARSTLHAKLKALIRDGILEATEQKTTKPYQVRNPITVQI